ncbi:hypothetical protein DFH29DRAFT_927219 [Suillus ampliporus]|nr:hypothetical protein DFH29DRAFT_927219 [Suillus ampliporus]
MSMHLHKSTLTNLPSASFSRLGQAPDQDSMRSTLQSCLECLDRHNDRMVDIYREVMDIRSHITELLASCQPEVTMGDEGARAGVDPAVGQLSRDLFTSGFVSYELDAQPFRVLPHHDLYSEGQTLSDSSARRDEPLPLPIEQGSQDKDKVKCTWPGCSRPVNKDNLTRHVNEMHRRRVKAVCAGCGKGFARPYMMKNHILQSHRFKSFRSHSLRKSRAFWDADILLLRGHPNALTISTPCYGAHMPGTSR